MAGFDLTCLASGVFLAWAAWKMQHRKMYDQINATLCGDIRKSNATLYLT